MKKMLFLLIMFLSTEAQAGTFFVMVTEVIDGDTFKFKMDLPNGAIHDTCRMAGYCTGN